MKTKITFKAKKIPETGIDTFQGFLVFEEFSEVLQKKIKWQKSAGIKRKSREDAAKDCEKLMDTFIFEKEKTETKK
jgi:hypothetical protein